ncbi:hypothetical protein [Fodinibius sp. AD559]|uniref:hypothetical protein n=1 Tax=Fodinibius sp. AD559 TaxID=3424179 RepID=UPI004046A208
MKNSLPIVLILLLAFSIWACEQPESPDFQVNHELEVPLSVEKTYPFMGEGDALIDSTSEDYLDLFSSDGDGMVSLTKEQDFDFGDLNDAIPTVDVPVKTLNTQVGELNLTDFNSGSGNAGSASFEDIFGFTPPSQGTFISAGSTPTPANIPFNTDFFESAVIKQDGSLELTLTNNLGMDLDQLDITLNSDNEIVGSSTENNFLDDETRTTTISIPANISATNPLENLNADVSASWKGQNKKEGDEFIVNSVAGQNLVASQVTAALESQSFNNSGTSTVDESSFEFQDSEDFVELSTGKLSIDITNKINLAVPSLDITFPDIRDASTDNPLVLNLSNIPSSSQNGGNFSTTTDLADYRIYAENGTIDYNISATTENTQPDTRTINESDLLEATVDLNNLEISRAEGFINTDVVLNEDVTGDGNVDVFNDDEAEVTNIDGISDISDRISGLTFENPILSTIYNTNLGVNTTIYAIIAGTDNKGTTEYLTGKDGTPYQVQSGEIPNELEVSGQPATTDQVIKFSIKPAGNPDPNQGELGSNEFNSSNTNSSEFFSNLPNKISFVGAAVINDDGTIVNPVIFDPSLGLDLPLNFSADAATFTDTLDADLGSLPGEGDDQSLEGATLTLNYTNALPLELGLVLTMLDENGNEVFQKPPEGEEKITVDGAGIDGNGYVNQPAESDIQISFSKEELKALNRTRSIMLDVEINTPQQQAVRIRNDDSVTLQIQIKADITSTVN